jgi:transcriptional regulator with XRE-family HTH domain
MEIRALLRSELERRGMSQAALARAVGVGPALVSRWLNEEEPVTPSSENCARIADVLGLDQLLVLSAAGHYAARETSPSELSATQAAAVAWFERLIRQTPDANIPRVRPVVEQAFALANSFDPPSPKDNAGGTPQRSRAEITLEEPRLEHTTKAVNSWRVKDAPRKRELVPA